MNSIYSNKLISLSSEKNYSKNFRSMIKNALVRIKKQQQKLYIPKTQIKKQRILFFSKLQQENENNQYKQVIKYNLKNINICKRVHLNLPVIRKNKQNPQTLPQSQSMQFNLSRFDKSITPKKHFEKYKNYRLKSQICRYKDTQDNQQLLPWQNTSQYE